MQEVKDLFGAFAFSRYPYLHSPDKPSFLFSPPRWRFVILSPPWRTKDLNVNFGRDVICRLVDSLYTRLLRFRLFNAETYPCTFL